MKRCRKCNFQSDAMLDYCWQCGAALADAGHFGQNARPTGNYSVPNHPTQSCNNYGRAYRPYFRPRRTSFSFGGAALVLGGIFCFFLAIAGAGAAVIYKVVNEPRNARVPEYRNRRPVETPKIPENPVSDKRKSGKASAELEKIRVDHEVREDGRFGMRIHVRFSVFNMKNVDSLLTVSFEEADGAQLTTANRKFANKDGQVAVSRALKPGWDETVYKDLDVFMPYDELKLGPGKYALKMDADVVYRNGEPIEHLGYQDFRYEKK